MAYQKFENRQYELIRASDIIHDGIWLELWGRTNGVCDEVLTVHYSDSSNYVTRLDKRILRSK